MQLAIPSYISPCHDIFLKDFSNTLQAPSALHVQIQYKYGRNRVPMQHKSKYNTRPTRALRMIARFSCNYPQSPTTTAFYPKLGPQTTDSPLLISTWDPYLWRPLYLNLLLLLLSCQIHINMVLHKKAILTVLPLILTRIEIYINERLLQLVI